MNYYVNPISETQWEVHRDDPPGLLETYDNYPDAEAHCEWLNHFHDAVPDWGFKQ